MSECKPWCKYKDTHGETQGHCFATRGPFTIVMAWKDPDLTRRRRSIVVTGLHLESYEWMSVEILVKDKPVSYETIAVALGCSVGDLSFRQRRPHHMSVSLSKDQAERIAKAIESEDGGTCVAPEGTGW